MGGTASTPGLCCVFPTTSLPCGCPFSTQMAIEKHQSRLAGKNEKARAPSLDARWNIVEVSALAVCRTWPVTFACEVTKAKPALLLPVASVSRVHRSSRLRRPTRTTTSSTRRCSSAQSRRSETSSLRSRVTMPTRCAARVSAAARLADCGHLQ